MSQCNCNQGRLPCSCRGPEVKPGDCEIIPGRLEGNTAPLIEVPPGTTFHGGHSIQCGADCGEPCSRGRMPTVTHMGGYDFVDATHSEDGREVVTDIADLFADSKCAICGDTGHFIVDDTGPEYVTSPCPECNAPDAWRMFDGEGGYDYTHDEETAERWKKHCGEKYASWVEPLYLSAPSGSQHSRIVASKDAEIARLRELHENAHSAAKTLMAERATLMEQAAHWLEVNAPSGGCIETNIADELRAEAEQLRAQPARQVGGGERDKFIAWAIESFPDAYTREAAEHYWDKDHVSALAWRARRGLAPAAAALDGSASLINALEQVRTMVGNDEYADDVIGFINRSIYNHARLNRRAIPEALLESLCAPQADHERLKISRLAAAIELRALLGKEGE